MLISNAYADMPGGLDTMLQSSNFLFICLMVAAGYFAIIRPQVKRQKELKALLDALTKGAEVATAGGILGKIVKVSDIYVTLEVSDGTEMIVQKSAVTQLLPTGTIKAL